MSDFATQFAIRLPNGELYTRCQHSHLFGTQCDREPVVFDTREQAENGITMLARSAQELGIDNWADLACIESRLCSPFSQTDPGEQFVDELTKWTERQGES
ncbi:hypothetical protein [Mycobacterium sp. PSTR-4-N]|uniref:hypothetical protein n=1 Tax=Mycobacterium sp. PSTR-4-N TaxID=2917745 RepID=UPI001F156559|nr:hypothetical protein [Mycobacterium sp. PSTR-4-N]MCG7596310.1 hypothetical protein [Mycobacterium sp. PSTR-4-N]